MVSYEYNLYKSKNLKYIDKMLSECTFVWNHALALQRKYYKIFNKFISINKLKRHFAKRIKRTLLHSQTVQEILERLDNSYKRFFKRLAKRSPKFKSKKSFSSFVFKQGGYSLNGNVLTINKINKRFKFSYSRPYEGKIKQIRIIRDKCNRYTLMIIAGHSTVNSCRKTHDGASVGIDFGLKTYLTMSDGTVEQSPLFFYQYQKEIKKAHRNLSKSKKGSNNRKRRRFELNQLYRKVSNKRKDYQWKLAHSLCRNNDFIFLETLNIESMKRLWGKKISDLAHSSFVEKLKYVALKYGVTVHEIDRWYPSSKTCECGYINKSLTLKDRNWVCPKCGSNNDRDLLASKNILRRGFYELGSPSNSNATSGVLDVITQESHLL